jgi:hypothetical protein
VPSGRPRTWCPPSSPTLYRARVPGHSEAMAARPP